MPDDATKWTPAEANEALRSLLLATLKREKEIAARDLEVAAIEKRHWRAIDSSSSEISLLEAQLEEFYRAHPPREGQSIQLANGTLGLNVSSTPALGPLSEKWTWQAIEAALRKHFKSRFFHKPKPAGIDKVKVKAGMSVDELKKCGLKLEYTSTFYYDLKRLEKAA